VALSGVQALDRRTLRQQDEIAAARAEIEKLRAENRDLAARLARIEALLSAPKQDR
jgi:cell division protein FtsB